VESGELATYTRGEELSAKLRSPGGGKAALLTGKPLKQPIKVRGSFVE